MADLQLLAVVAATLSFLAIVFGNWLYVFYRAKTPDSPRSYVLATMPEVHLVFFEFKEFAAQVPDRPWLRSTVVVLLGLSFFYLLVAFGLGAAVTKLRPA